MNNIKIYAVISEEGLVTNVMAAEESFVVGRKDVVLVTGEVNIGDTYSEGKFSASPRKFDAEWEMIRSERNRIIAETDYVVLPDYWETLSKTEQTAWKKYRKELRDITSTFSDPAEVTFPEKPE
jgi:hypothetical protein